MKSVDTAHLIKRFQLEVISGAEWTHRPITTSDLNRPGVELAGYFEFYPAERVQIIGHTELSFLEKCMPEARKERLEKLCRPETPCIIVTRGADVPGELIHASKEYQVPILRSLVQTTRFLSQLTNYLEAKLAPTTSVHGVLVDIYGVGVLIMGKSGVGKSETALELVKRGHRLVADDCVDIVRYDDALVGHAPEMIEHLLEIRGLGILNIMTMFGVGAIRSEKGIGLIANLENWDQDKNYDRLGLDEETTKILDVQLPKLMIPVRPGRNLAVIIEVAAMNYRLKKMGINTAEQFAERLAESMKNEE